MDRHHAGYRALWMLFSISLLFSRAASAQWQDTGVPVCAPLGSQNNSHILADGVGGAFVVWTDERASSTGDLYAQRVDAWGRVLWNSSGVPICVAADNQYATTMLLDESGGVLLFWSDRRTGAYDVYGQRLDSTGVVLWQANGRPIATGAGDQGNTSVIHDGQGGLIVSWEDSRSGNYDIYAQRLNLNGVALWSSGGVPICTVATDQRLPKLVSDLQGGAIIGWEDARNDFDDVYAQRINAQGAIQWALNGIPVMQGPRWQFIEDVIPDGLGGAIIGVKDEGDGRPKAQHLNPAGTLLWNPPSGVALSSTRILNAYFITDGAGGIISVWEDERVLASTTYDIYAQRVDGSGVVRWQTDGVLLSGGGTKQARCKIVPSGQGGALAAWFDERSGGSTCDIYAQRVDANGNRAFGTSGALAARTTASINQSILDLTDDGAGGGIVAWYNSQADRVLVQRVLQSGQGGHVLNLMGRIRAVEDVPADEGGWVRIQLDAAGADWMHLSPSVFGYAVWRRIEQSGNAPNGAMTVDELRRHLAAQPDDLAAGTVVRSDTMDPSATTSMFPPGTWESAGFTPATGASNYALLAPTRRDVHAHSFHREVFVVSTHANGTGDFIVSSPDSGYSVDNVPPGSPRSVTWSREGARIEIDWGVGDEQDLVGYAIYRGSSSDFVPSPQNRVAFVTSPPWRTIVLRGSLYYKISAVDRHENESPWVTVLVDPSLLDGGSLQQRTSLSEPRPNPSTSGTTVELSLARPMSVSLQVLDVGGRIVSTLVDRFMVEGTHRFVWSGRDDGSQAVRPGVYWIRAMGPDLLQVRKVAIVR